MAGPGQITDYGAGLATTALLSNFDVGQHRLKAEHQNWLSTNVVPKLRAGGSVWLTGLTSTTGSEGSNLSLSGRRADAVVQFLTSALGKSFPLKLGGKYSLGESVARMSGSKDNVEEMRWRSVLVSAWDKPTPPPPPPPPPPAPEHAHVDRTQYKRWIGIGAKSGGQLGIGGVESTTAYMVNLGNGETFDLEIISSRWGLGLGGSGGAVIVLGFGFIEPYELDHKSVSDWGVNLAFTEKLISKSVMQSLVMSKHWVEIYRRERALRALKHVRSAFNDAEQISKVRDLLHTLYAGMESVNGSGVIVIDVPFAGVGLEVSGFVTRGTMYVSNSSDMDLAEYAE